MAAKRSKNHEKPNKQQRFDPQQQSELILPPPTEQLTVVGARADSRATSTVVVKGSNPSTKGLKRAVESHHAAYLRHLGASLMHSYVAGLALNTAKEGMSRGKWMTFLKDSFGEGQSTVCIRTCHRYMRLAKYIAIIAQERGIELNSTCVSNSEAEQILAGLSLNEALRLTHVAPENQSDESEPITTLETQNLGDGTQSAVSSPNNWLTPPNIVAALLKFWDRIDLDPCSEVADRPNIPAHKHYTCLDDGLAADSRWQGNVFMNPGQAGDLRPWVELAVSQFQTARIREAILLLPAVTDANWADLVQPFPRAFLHARPTVTHVSAPELQVQLMHPAMLVFLGSPERLSDFYEHMGIFADVFQPYSSLSS